MQNSNGHYWPSTYEQRTYNSMGQLTQTTGAINMQYTYSATQNNGRIVQSVDGRTGETVSYQYDALNRLLHAETADTTWGESYQYDQFGNLLLKTPTKGSAPAWAASYDPATNRQYGVSYDANGNPSAGYVWDVENRLTGQTSPDGASRSWGYDPWGKRAAAVRAKDGELATWDFTMYELSGKPLQTLRCQFSDTNHPYTPVCQMFRRWSYFAGRLTAGEDRLGSVGTYWPYGEERTTGQGEGEAFGTYWRDWPGQDYADQRYYNSTSGRFMTPDPSRLNVDMNDPGSWNAYSYTNGDPINLNDPSGLGFWGNVWNFIKGAIGIGSPPGAAVPGAERQDLDLDPDGGGGGMPCVDFSVLFLGDWPLNALAGGNCPNETKAWESVMQDRRVVCAGEALSKNGISIGLDLAGAAAGLVPAGDLAGALLQAGVNAASTVNSAANGDVPGAVGSIIGLQVSAVVPSANVLGLSAIPAVGTIISTLQAANDAYHIYTDYQACLGN